MHEDQQILITDGRSNVPGTAGMIDAYTKVNITLPADRGMCAHRNINLAVRQPRSATVQRSTRIGGAAGHTYRGRCGPYIACMRYKLALLLHKHTHKIKTQL